jgi:hypothetical protein
MIDIEVGDLIGVRRRAGTVADPCQPRYPVPRDIMPKPQTLKGGSHSTDPAQAPPGKAGQGALPTEHAVPVCA